MTLYCQIIDEHRDQPEATHEANWECSDGDRSDWYLVCPRHATAARKHGIHVIRLDAQRRAEIEGTVHRPGPKFVPRTEHHRAAVRVLDFLDARAQMGDNVDHDEVLTVWVKDTEHTLRTQDLRTLVEDALRYCPKEG